ncbi:murein hydrolase activator NlpD [Xenorhabdus bovienii]|uniref:murein hydrolase activator NlpD n=1 Tax=Xenorhabdus bovienii TaxID=40576 RepID=UPI0004D8653F|nr:murein hydrolase activator NlpD [Xenorhabdus bovienii]CDG89964.1 lipoprotein [Xenorhabdus bovienii str. feltiae France]CDG93773.1 lipoprotein [Xenorhabdus bovienii str. feltiae Florida]
MNLGNSVKKIKWISSVMGVVLAGCSNTSDRPAPIVSIDKQEQNRGIPSRTSSISTPMSSSPSTISVNRSSEHRASENRYLVNRAVENGSHQGRIVYNRNYGNIPKGSYSGSTYMVKSGDTLFYVAWITGIDFRDLSHRNNISEPYNLNVGQVLRMGNVNSSNGVLLASNSTQSKIEQVDFQKSNAYPANIDRQSSEKMLPRKAISVSENSALKSSPATDISPSSTISSNSSSWGWPAEGKVFEGFSDSKGGNKGIDIAGSRGQPVFATASGKVVYAGNALRGYGNLIIIKHNDDYLSAYAHNDTMLVRDSQDVQAGQKIATMGSTGTSLVKLHFEIRYKGKSVNPLRHLPQR